MSYGNDPGDPRNYGAPQEGSYPPPAGYGYPPQGPYGYPPQAPGTNGMAITSLIMGIVGLVVCGFTAVLGVILGHVAISQIKRTGEQGHGMAVAGLIVSYIAIAAWILLAVVWLGILSAVGTSTTGIGY
ncbi:DUF4190 domain-containing protein [Microbispora sp. NPDC049125]|uniref:DUF4190 domain-containing protein n=1 Tax=Microbispora sp. NPDC049125 TaxID=3154929 RepID=UPI0034651FD5